MYKDDVEQKISEYAVSKKSQYIARIRRRIRIDQGDAEAIFQDALLAAWQGRAGVRGDSFAAYFDGILRNRIAMKMMERSKRRETPLWGSDSGADRLAVLEDDCVQNPATAILAEQVMEELSPDDRELLRRWSHGGLRSHREDCKAERIRARLRKRFNRV